MTDRLTYLNCRKGLSVKKSELLKYIVILSTFTFMGSNSKVILEILLDKTEKQ